MLKADGWSNLRIARRLGVADDTLDKYFAEDLKEGADREREFALGLLRKVARTGNVSAIKEYIKIVGAGGAVEDFLDQPDRRERVVPKGRKEVALEDAINADPDGSWGDDLAPLVPRTVQ